MNFSSLRSHLIGKTFVGNLKFHTILFSFFFILLSTTSAQATKVEDEQWEELFKCFDKHGSNVAAVVQSLDEGASLIVETLCQKESTNLLNTMHKERKELVKSKGIAGAFSSLHYVIERELRGMLYKEKLRQYNKK